MIKLFHIKVFVVCVTLMALFVFSNSSPAATHLHSHPRGSHFQEREDDGAYSPRDKAHHSDGDHHVEFDHEAILGSHKAAEEYDQLPPDEAKKRLEVLLKKMDLNKDEFISRQELKSWILRSFRMLSEEESNDRFEDSDMNGDGFVTWDEYYADTFGLESSEVVDESDQELMQEDKKMFNLADKNQDERLDKKEFLLFSHPEEHPEMFPLILEQTLKEKDTNNNSFIEFQEYIGERGRDHDKEWLQSEKTKFDTDYDKDHDGRLNKVEILDWIVPSNDDIAEEEADHLISECDVDGDKMLTYQEAIDQHDVFVGSEATDYGEHLQNLHVFQDEL